MKNALAVFAVFALALLPAIGAAQVMVEDCCSQRVMPAVTYSKIPPDEVEPKWWAYANSPDLYLWQGDYRCLGYWDQRQGLYFPFKAETQQLRRGSFGVAWNDRKTNVPPLPLPAGYHASQASQSQVIVGDAFGVDRGKLSKTERCEINGTPATSSAATTRLQELADDSKLWHVTMITSNKSLQQRVHADFRSHPALTSLAKQIRFQTYDPTQKPAAKMLAVFRLDVDERYQQSQFAILVQPPAGADGKAEVHPLYRYDGPEALAEFVRSVNPAYDPNRNRSPAEDLTPVVIGIAVVAGFFMLVMVAIVARARPAE